MSCPQAMVSKHAFPCFLQQHARFTWRACSLRLVSAAEPDTRTPSTSLLTISTQMGKPEVGCNSSDSGCSGRFDATVDFDGLSHGCLHADTTRVYWTTGFGADNYDKFSGATSIGSDQYFGSGPTSGGRDDSGFGGGGGFGGGDGGSRGGRRQQGESVFGVSKLISKLGGQ